MNTPASATGMPRTRLYAIVLFAAIMPFVLMAAPVIASQYGSQLGFGPAQIGQLFSVEMAAMSLATLPAWFWQPRADWRTVARLCTLVFVLANIVSGWMEGFWALVSLRFISGLGGGSIMVICLSSAAGSDNRDRAYGLWVVGQLVLGAVGLWILPPLFASFGLKAAYLLMALLALLCLPLAGAFPAASPCAPPPAAAAHGDAAAMPWGGMICALLAVLLFYVGLSGVWTFVETIAQASAIEAADSGRILSVATLLGIAGAASAAAIGKRWPRPQMLLLGYGLMVLSVLLWFGLPGIIRYAAGALIFKYTWTFVLPFVLACVADLDRNSRLINITNLVIGGGIAIGPALAGSMLEPGAVGMTGVLTLSAVCLAASLGLILGSRKLGQSHTATPIPSGASSS